MHTDAERKYAAKAGRVQRGEQGRRWNEQNKLFY